jgi:hypothetical protein
MVNSTISYYGGSVCVGPKADETFVTAKADGTSKAGNMVTILSTGFVDNTDVNAVDFFVGIMMERYDTDIDTAPTSGKLVQIVIPKVGHKYRVLCSDMDTSAPGQGATFSTTEGVLAKVTDIEATHVCRTSKYEDGDTVAEVIWGD